MMYLELQNSTRFASVLDEHWERLLKFKWYEGDNTVYRNEDFKNRFRGCGRKASRPISLANEVMNSKGILYDHKDRNYLNNIPDNLRVASLAQNSFNRTKKRNCSSSYKGVHFNKKNLKWQAQIGINRIRIHLGYFYNEKDAAKAYNIAAIKHFGEFSVLNSV